MTATEKQEFITDLTQSVRDELIAKIPKMPEDWDGHELRELIAEKFWHERSMVRCYGRNAKRIRAYKITIYNSNL